MPLTHILIHRYLDKTTFARGRRCCMRSARRGGVNWNYGDWSSWSLSSCTPSKRWASSSTAATTTGTTVFATISRPWADWLVNIVTYEWRIRNSRMLYSKQWNIINITVWQNVTIDPYLIIDGFWGLNIIVVIFRFTGTIEKHWKEHKSKNPFHKVHEINILFIATTLPKIPL